jgi:predicted phage-related endonuclease
VFDEQKPLFAFGREFGHIDGLGIGFPEAPKSIHLLEFKTHNDKNFKILKKEGPPKKHLIQMQIYMHLLGPDVRRAMYLAINKNDDEIFQARIEYDKEFAEAQMQKAERIAMLKTPPQRIDDRPEFYICRMCHLRETCHSL